MTKISRNDPCPCGSGKKYKKCCMAAADAPAPAAHEDKTVVPRMLDWLAKHYQKELGKAVMANFFGSLDGEELDRLYRLHPELQEMVNINLGEWTIGDAEITVKGKPTPVRSLLLGQAGPLMTAPARDWLERVVERPMSLYEVRKVKPGEGVEVADLLRPDEPVVWVVERAGSQSMVRWDTIGARLVRKGEGWVFSGGLYPLPRDAAASCRESILREIGDAGWNSGVGRKTVAWAIIGYWLHELVMERPLPKLVDASTNEPIALVTEHFRIVDLAALEAALEAQPDVAGDRAEGWVRLVDLEDGEQRLLASLYVTRTDTLEVFCRAVKVADETRSWLEALAGKALKHKAREVVDPRSPKAMAAAGEPKPTKLSSEEETKVLHEVLMKHYSSWPDTEVPALGGKTPRQAVKSKEGRRAVVELLKEFELLEARNSAKDGTKAFDFGFLWESLGLVKEKNS